MLTPFKVTVLSDKKCRKGCHPVMLTTKNGKGKEITNHIFSIDEPGTWFDDKWNCHADGTDYPFDTIEKCIVHGLKIYGYIDIEK